MVVAIDAQRGQLLAELADHRTQRHRPRRWKRVGPEQLRKLGLGDSPLPLGHQVNEGQAPLAAAEIGVPQQLIAALDGHLTSQVDAKH